MVHVESAKPLNIHEAAAGTHGDPWGTLGEPEPKTPARLLHLVETSAATLRHAFCPAGTIIPYHRHDRESVVYGVGGPCFESRSSEPGRSPEAVTRRLTYRPRSYAHSLRFAGPTHLLAVEFGESLDSSPVSRPLPATLYGDIWRAMLRFTDGQSADLVAEALNDLISKVRHCIARPAPLWLEGVIDQIHATWQEPQGVNRLARTFRVSPQHLCRAFKRHLGVTIGQYSLLLRLDYARGLLWGTGMPIAEVAAETGFSDQAHLTRALHAHSMKTPARLRWKAPCLDLASLAPTSGGDLLSFPSRLGS